MGRVSVDTGVLVLASRGGVDVSAVIGDDDVTVAAIVLAEYQLGILLTQDSPRQQLFAEFLAGFRALAPVDDYTADVASHHADLMAHTRRTGRPRGAHDLVIAATARATGRTLLTTDARAAFDDLPGVSVRVIS